jgi:hypothetical protein
MFEGHGSLRDHFRPHVTLLRSTRKKNMLDMGEVSFLAGLAALDSLNPFTIAVLAYLLGTSKPNVRVLIFIVGTFATYLLGGVLLLQGWTAALTRFAQFLPWWWVGVALAVAGLASFAACFFVVRRARAGLAFTPPANLSIMTTIVFTVSSTVADLPTAIPYFVAIETIGRIPTLARQIVALILYNAVYCLPLFVMFSARWIMGARSAQLFDRLRRGVDWAFAKLIAPGLAILGAYLLVASFMRLSGQV